MARAVRSREKEVRDEARETEMEMMNMFPFRNVQTGYKVWVSQGHLGFSDWACLRDVACGEFTRVREERT